MSSSEDAFAGVTAALAGLLPARCGVASVIAKGPLEAPRPEEAPAIKAAHERRQRTFAAGRAAARQALARIGAPQVAIPVGTGGAPLWPAGITGSITHIDDLAIAAVARVADVPALGIDLERADAVTEDLWGQLFLEAEIKFLRSLGAPARAGAAATMFSLKEAFYKFQHPHTGRWLEFRDVAISLDFARSRGVLEAPAELAIASAVSRRYVGNFRLTGNLVISAFALPAEPAHAA